MHFCSRRNFSAAAQTLQYKSGDRVECDTTETGKWWTKGTIMPFQPGDFGGGQEPDGSWYHFKADYNGVEYPCKPKFMRPLAGAKTDKPTKTEKPQKPKKLRPKKKTKLSRTAIFSNVPSSRNRLKTVRDRMPNW